MTLPFDPAQLQQLDDLRSTDPERYWLVIAELAKHISPDAAHEQLKEALRAKARETDGYENFLAYYELIHSSQLEPHDLQPVQECFLAHAAGEIFEWLGFRGCRKTSTIDVTLDSFLLGHHPEGTGVVTGANDPNSKLIAKSIAQIIEYHPEFRATFPHVVIDKDRGWGAEGYWIRDTRITREAWTAQQAKVNDPSFIGGGYKSSEINGKHPTLFLSVDDLHDIDSSGSVTERENIKTVFITQILPTVPSEGGKLSAWVNITGVPFSKDDTYATLRDSGGVRYVGLPVMKRAPEGEGTYIDGINPKTGAVYDDIVGWWILTWAANFTPEAIISWRSKGKSMFWQMFMIDIEVAKTAGLRYYLYPASKIAMNWPTNGGADPTSFTKDAEVGGHTRSTFAHSWLSKLPQGGLVLVGGTLKKCSMEQSKENILEAQTKFDNWGTTGVEDVGVGKIYLQYLWTDKRVRAVASDLKLHKEIKGRIKSKPDRILIELSPWLDNMVIRISDEENDYNMAVRRGLDNFFDLSPDDAAWDALDGLYHATKLFPEVLRIPDVQDLSPEAMTQGAHLYSAWSRI
jgi:hypothetical protein